MNMNLIEIYIEARGHRYSNDTMTSYLTDLKQFLEFMGNLLEKEDDKEIVQGVQYIHCIRYLTHMKSRNLSPFTINRKLSSVSNFLDFCIDLEIIDNNNIKKIDRFITTDIEQNNDFLTQDEYRMLLDAIRTKVPNQKRSDFIVARDTFLFSLLLTTGLRITEARTLKIKQVDLENKKIKPLRKGRKFQDIYITDELIQLYNEYMIQRERICLDEEAEDMVFVSITGKTICTKDCNKALAKYCRRANIKVVTCHNLRHTCATTLMKRGASLEDVSNLLGHRSLSTTSRYIHGQASNVSKFMGL